MSKRMQLDAASLWACVRVREVGASESPDVAYRVRRESHQVCRVKLRDGPGIIVGLIPKYVSDGAD